MQVVGISGLHRVLSVVNPNSDYVLAEPTATGKLTTIQSIFLKTPAEASVVFTVKTKKGSASPVDILNVEVPENSTQIINVKQQLPEAVSMLVSASVGGSTVTVNGIIAEF